MEYLLFILYILELFNVAFSEAGKSLCGGIHRQVNKNAQIFSRGLRCSQYEGREDVQRRWARLEIKVKESKRPEGPTAT